MNLPEGASDPDHTAAAGALPRAGGVPRVGPGLWLWALAAGLMAGLVSGLAGEATAGWLDPHLRPASLSAPAAQRARQAAILRAAEINKVALPMALFAGFEGLFLGLAGGLAARAWRRAVAAGLAGLVVGVAAAAVCAFAVMPYYRDNVNFLAESFHASLLIHCALWLPAGAAGGLALGRASGGARPTALAATGGVAGAAAGTVLFEVLGVLAFPLDRTGLPLADSVAARMLARLLVSVLAALLAVAFLSEQSQPKTMKAPPKTA